LNGVYRDGTRPRDAKRAKVLAQDIDAVHRVDSGELAGQLVVFGGQELAFASFAARVSMRKIESGLTRGAIEQKVGMG